MGKVSGMKKLAVAMTLTVFTCSQGLLMTVRLPPASPPPQAQGGGSRWDRSGSSVWNGAAN